MFRWLSGKLVLQDFRRNLRYLQDNLGTNAARDCCMLLLRQIFAIKHEARFGGNAELRAAKDAYSLTLSHLPSGWLKRIQPDTATAALLENWLSAKLATLTGELDPRVFRLIDDGLWSFAKDRLKPKEIEAIHVEVEEAALYQRRRSATDVIDELIKDYAEIAKGAVNPTMLVDAPPHQSDESRSEALRG